MKLAVLSFSGNVGKSTLATQLLKPRMPGASLLMVETLNSHPAGAAKSFDPARYEDILIALESAADVIVDVGSKCADVFVREAQRFDSLTSDFDLFLVPATADTKVLADTVATIQALNERGVHGTRILCLPSRVVRPEEVAYDFASIDAMRDDKFIACGFDPTLSFVENEVFARLRAANRTLEDVLEDSSDLGASLRAAVGEPDRLEAAAALITRRLASGAKAPSDALFAGILKAAAQAHAKPTA